jgi:hypothetical protein
VSVRVRCAVLLVSWPLAECMADNAVLHYGCMMRLHARVTSRWSNVGRTRHRCFQYCSLLAQCGTTNGQPLQAGSC